MSGLLPINIHGVSLLFDDSVQNPNLTMFWFVTAAAAVELFALVLVLSRK